MKKKKIKINLNILDLRFKSCFSVLRIKDYNSFFSDMSLLNNKKKIKLHIGPKKEGLLLKTRLDFFETEKNLL